MNSRVNNSQPASTDATYPRGRSLGMSDILLRAQVRVQTALYSLRHRQEGQGLVEYGLIIASIAVLLIVAMLFLAGKIDNLFSDTGASVDSPGPLIG